MSMERSARSQGIAGALLAAVSAVWVVGVTGAAAVEIRTPAPGPENGGAAESGPEADKALRVCADPSNLPQSNDRGEGYENRIAEALAHDLGRTLEYTWFPQRMGFVRNTLRARDEATLRYKCDLIIGVPTGYELTATTRPYLHSTYALVSAGKVSLEGLKSGSQLLDLGPQKLHTLHLGAFVPTPGADWIMRNGLVEQANWYPSQSGDPHETPELIVERDLEAGKIDVAVLWGPIAGYLVSRHASEGGRWAVVPFAPEPSYRFDYQISMGVRRGEKAWRDLVDNWIGTHQATIDQILQSYHVPMLALAPAPAT